MAIKKIQIKPPNNDYADVLHPETSADMVKMADGSTVEETVNAVKNTANSKQNALPADQRRKITVSTDEPSGGDDGDIWFIYAN